MESPEYKAIVSCGRSLQELIGYSYRGLTPSLRSSGLISGDTEERTRLNSTGSDIASNILGNVQSSIKADSSLYLNFLEILDDPYYDCVRRELESAREKHSRSQVGILESADQCNTREDDDDVFYSSQVTTPNSSLVLCRDATDSKELTNDEVTSVESSGVPSDNAYNNMEQTYNQEKNVVRVAEKIEEVKKLKSLAILMNMSSRDWDYVMKGVPVERKRERLAQLWVKKKNKESLQLLEKILIQPAVNERRISQQISRDLSGDSGTGSIGSPNSSLTSSVELDSSYQQMSIEGCERHLCTQQNVLNYLEAQYPADWEAIGRHLIGHGEVERIKNDVEMRSDPTAYIVELWWRITTEGDFSWSRLKEAIKKALDEKQLVPVANRKKTSRLIEDLYDEFEKICRKYCECLTSQSKCDDFCELMQNLPHKWRGLDKYYEDSISKLINAKDDSKDGCIDDFFKAVKHRIWNFIDYEFLGYLIRKYGGSPELTKQMDIYEDKVDEMCRTTTIDEFINLWDPIIDEDDIPEEMHTSVMKLDWNPREHYIWDLKIAHIKCKTRVSQKVVMAASVLVDIFSGSITMLWIVFITPDDLPQLRIDIKNLIRENPEYFVLQEVSLFVLDDFVVYPSTEQNMLWNAAREGNQGEVEDLLTNHDVNVNHVYEMSQRSVFQCAAKHGHKDVVDLLLSYKADVDYCDAKGYTALMIALRSGQKDVSDFLIWHGANMDIQDKVWGMSPFLIAAKQNDTQTVERCLKKNASLIVRNKNKKTVLILAAESGHEEVVHITMKYLQKCSGDVQQIVYAQDVNDRTALHAAAECGNINIVKDLASYSEIIGIIDENQETALDIAIRNGHEEIASFLLGANKLEQSMEAATTKTDGAQLKGTQTSEGKTGGEGEREMDRPTEEEEGQKKEGGDGGAREETSDIHQPDVMEEKVKKLNFVQKLYQTFRGGNEVKFVDAAAKGQYEVVRIFLEEKQHNPNIPKPDKQSWTALMWACLNSHIDIVKLLLDRGASPNIVSENKFSPLMVASREGHYEIVKALLENKDKPDINAVNQIGWNALMWASQTKGWKKYTREELMENHLKIVKELIAAGADVNHKTENGWTPLMQASQDGNVELVKVLCNEQNININHQSKSTWSALTIACLYEREPIAKLLVDADADLTIKKEGGVTALHIACFKGLTNVVKQMVPPLKSARQRRIDVNVKDNWGMTPLTLAMKAGHKELVKYLVKDSRAEVNIQAEKYLQWSVIFFALQNKDMDSYRLLVDSSANTELVDEYGYTLMSIVGGSYFPDPSQKKFSKEFMKEIKKQLRQKGIESSPPLPPPRTLNDTRKYYSREREWRNEQRPHLISAGH